MRAHSLISAFIPCLASTAWGQLCEPDFTPQHIGRALPTFTLPVADLDGDGDPDVVTPQYDLELQVFENLGGDPPRFDLHDLSGGPCGNSFGHVGAHAADIDGDRDIDILCVPSSGSGDVSWFENRGGSPPDFCEHQVGELGSSSGFAPHTYDIDADGDLDLISSVMTDKVGESVAFYENLGGSPASFRHHFIAFAYNAMSVWGADLDGDGDGDVLAAATVPTDDGVRWYENDGGSPPSFSERLLPIDPPGEPWYITAADLDGDGDQDAIYSARDVARRWLENIGGTPPQFVPRSFGEGANDVYTVRAVDLDRDGRVDVLCGEEGEVVVYLNQGGSPPMFRRCVLAASDNCMAAEPGDIDLDGATDVVVRFGPDVYWLENARCVADFDADGVVDTRDFLAFLNAWTGGSPQADVNGDGRIDTRDVLAFLNLWAEGCG